VNAHSPAAAELDGLLGHPALSGRWHDGFTTDDVLAELTELGRITIDVRDDLPSAGDDVPPRFACHLELRDEAAGTASGEGHSLTAAALRCLMQAEDELVAEVERGLDALRQLLGER
jgi:hypothetical protein